MRRRVWPQPAKPHAISRTTAGTTREHPPDYGNNPDNAAEHLSAPALADRAVFDTV